MYKFLIKKDFSTIKYVLLTQIICLSLLLVETVNIEHFFADISHNLVYDFLKIILMLSYFLIILILAISVPLSCFLLYNRDIKEGSIVYVKNKNRIREFVTRYVLLLLVNLILAAIYAYITVAIIYDATYEEIFKEFVRIFSTNIFVLQLLTTFSIVCSFPIVYLIFKQQRRKIFTKFALLLIFQVMITVLINDFYIGIQFVFYGFVYYSGILTLYIFFDIMYEGFKNGIEI